MNTQTDKKINTSDDEIDLLELAKTIWKGKRTVLKYTLICMCIGFFVAVFSEKEYTAETIMVPQSGEGKQMGGSLGGLAAMAGINLGGSSSYDIPPSLYPQIINSIPFQKEMMKTMISISEAKEKISFADYYINVKSIGLFGFIKKYTLGIPGILIDFIKGDNTLVIAPPKDGLIRISADEKKLISLLRSQLSIQFNDKDGYITLTSKMPEALAAAQMARAAQDYLQEKITEFKIKKANIQLEFIKDRFDEKEKEFQIIQNRLAVFRDRNRNVSTAIAQTKLEQLQADYNLTYGVYSALAKKVETQKIQVKEDTPMFTVIQPVSVPVDKSKPKRPIILIVWTFLGGILGVGIVSVRGFLVNIKKKW